MVEGRRRDYIAFEVINAATLKETLKAMSIRELVCQEIGAVAAEQGKSLPPLSDDLVLLECGLDSLCFAILVSRLEDATGRDPFAAAKASEFPRTVGEFVAFYEPLHA